MSFSYANPTSGPSAGGIGWFNFNTFSTINPGQTFTGLTGTLNDGTTVTFDLTASNVSGGSRSFDAVPVPIFAGAAFGAAGYTGITGNVALDATTMMASGANRLTLSNIVVKDTFGNPVPNYTAVVADAETTGAFESWDWTTNGGVWAQLAVLGTGASPVLTGLGTPTATLTGNAITLSDLSYVLTTQNPTQLELTTTNTTALAAGREGVAIGFATTHVRLEKNVAARINPADQFSLTVNGTPSGTATTTGAGTGLQSEAVNVFAIPNTPYNVSEAMAPGSISALVDYTQTVSVANATPAGSIPPTGNLPISFTPALGDDVTYTILNAVPETFIKTVDKAFADVGEIITYTITVDNPNDFALTNVLVIDSTPAGTTYLGNIVASLPYTGANLATGITFPTIPADTTVNISWQVQVNSVPPIPTPVPNVGTITVPGGTSGITNTVTTQVNTAYVSVLKMVDKAFANPGDTLTYTLTLNNAGNVAANNVVLTDALPAGTTLVPGSITGATGTLPMLKLVNSIPSGGSAVISFQVKVDGIPAVNPIPNLASAAYTYTVNPAQPNAKTGTTRSNTVTTQVSIASLTTTKTVDKHTAYLGDIVTYQIAVANTGNVPANNVILTDPLPDGVSLVPGSLVVSVPYSGSLAVGIQLTNPIAPEQPVTLSFKVKVDAIPNPNPVINQATANYAYTLDPRDPNGKTGTVTSNKVCTLVFRYNFGQQISDVIQSVALEQAALAAIANAEGAKIQKLAAAGGISTQELLCLNQSVTNMMDSIVLLEMILRQKLGILDCQINGCLK